MTDTAKVCAALRACDECDPHGDNVLAGCHSCRFLAAVAEVVEAAERESQRIEDVRNVLKLSHPGPRVPGSCPREGGECCLCALRDCPHMEPLHYHHDGCPMCDMEGTPTLSLDEAIRRAAEVCG